MKRSFLMIAGFVIFVIGFIALVLSVVGLKLSYLAFIDRPGATFGFVVRLLMIIGGMVLFYLARSQYK